MCGTPEPAPSPASGWRVPWRTGAQPGHRCAGPARTTRSLLGGAGGALSLVGGDDLGEDGWFALRRGTVLGPLGATLAGRRRRGLHVAVRREDHDHVAAILLRGGLDEAQLRDLLRELAQQPEPQL